MIGMLSITDPILTDRLVIRRFRETDLVDLVAFESLPEVVRYLYWDDLSGKAIQERLTRRLLLHTITTAGDGVLLAAEHAASGKVIGHVMLEWVSQQHAQGEIGFVFDPRFQRQGYGTEATTAVMKLGFARLDLHRIVGRADARNVASAALMRRLGMRQEAMFRQDEYVKGEWTDTVLFAALADEWPVASAVIR
jgi:RimJ/RimL family protein N-acetyltransferase